MSAAIAKCPGLDLADTCERKSPSLPEAAALFGVECADLTAVIKGRAPVPVHLALLCGRGLQ